MGKEAAPPVVKKLPKVKSKTETTAEAPPPTEEQPDHSREEYQAERIKLYNENLEKQLVNKIKILQNLE